MLDQRASGRSLSDEPSGFELPSPSDLPRSKFLLRFRWVVLLMFAAVLFSLGRHAGAVQREQEILRAKTIEAGRFELRRPDGKQAAVLSTGPDGEALLSFLDQKGSTRLTVGIDSKGEPSISFFGEKNDLRMALSLDPVSHSPHVRLLDEHGDPQLMMGVDDRLGPSISVGKLNKTRISLSTDDRGPSILFYDGENNPRISLSIVKNEPVVELLDRNRTPRSLWKVHKDGSPEFALSDRASNLRLQLSSDANGKSSVRFLDANGHVTKEIGE